MKLEDPSIARKNDLEQRAEYEALLRVVKAAKKVKFEGIYEKGKEWYELEEALEALPEHLRGER